MNRSVAPEAPRSQLDSMRIGETVAGPRALRTTRPLEVRSVATTRIGALPAERPACRRHVNGRPAGIWALHPPRLVPKREAVSARRPERPVRTAITIWSLTSIACGAGSDRPWPADPVVAAGR